MKKIISIILSALILVSVFAAVPLSAGAYTEKSNDEFEYLIDEEDNYALIFAYLGHDSEVVIPDTLEGYPVEGICEYAFHGCDFVTNIKYPDTIEYVGPKAIDDTAFYDNDDNWENDVFYIGKVLYAAADDLEGECTVKSGTVSITEGAFTNCAKMTKLTIPGTVKTLPLKTFMYCDELTDLIVEEGVETVEPKAFVYCKKLDNIKLPKSIKTVYQQAFTHTGYYDNEYNWDNGALYLDHILLEVDYECTGDFVVRDGTTLLANQAFVESDVTRVYLPKGLKRISEGTFNMCRFLKEIVFNDDIEELGTVWSAYNDVMTSFEVPASVKKLDYRSFAFSTFSEIKLNENLKEIGEQAFVSCEKINEITVPKNVETIGDYAFGYIAHTTLEGYTLEKIDDFVIKGYPGSKAEEYANKFGFKFVDISVKDINGCKVTGINAKTYNGKAQTQSVTVKDGDKTLVKGTDYTVTYKNNKNAGTASMTITGKGNYKGSKTVSFKINKAANPISVKARSINASAKKNTNFVKSKAFIIKNAKGSVSFRKVSGNKKITITKAGKITVEKGLKKGKTYSFKVTVTANGDKNYKSGSKTVTVKVKIK